MSALPLSGPEFERLEAFFAASIEQADRLRREQRHDAAAGVLVGLRRLCNTVREAAAEHGFLSAVVLNRWPDEIERRLG